MDIIFTICYYGYSRKDEKIVEIKRKELIEKNWKSSYNISKVQDKFISLQYFT